MDQVKGLRQQIDSSLRYLNAHAGEGVDETLRSGRIPETMMERIMGYVDGMRVPKARRDRHEHEPPARVFDDLFGDAAPANALTRYVDRIAEHERTNKGIYSGCAGKDSGKKAEQCGKPAGPARGRGMPMTADKLDKGDKRRAGAARAQAKARRRTVNRRRGEQRAARRYGRGRHGKRRSKDGHNNPLQAGHEYEPGDYDELIKGSGRRRDIPADEWDQDLGFVGKNPRASNLGGLCIIRRKGVGGRRRKRLQEPGQECDGGFGGN